MQVGIQKGHLAYWKIKPLLDLWLWIFFFKMEGFSTKLLFPRN
jgi:hypothetical protein